MKLWVLTYIYVMDRQYMKDTSGCELIGFFASFEEAEKALVVCKSNPDPDNDFEILEIHPIELNLDFKLSNVEDI